jgi:transglutaminase-like putative cysteine protease
MDAKLLAKETPMPENDASSVTRTCATGPSAATRAATALIDSDHPAVRAFAAAHAVGTDDRTRATALYGAVRDGFRYDPYRADLSPAGMTASHVLAQGYGWCVPKATLLAAACRAAGIPARLGFADVRNHLSTERMRSSMETEIFYWHGYTEIWIEGAWRKATPAFNLSLCQKFGLLPLDFDGLTDSIYHPFDAAGNRHMEYVAQRGSFDDLPLDLILQDFRQHYPKWLATMAEQHGTDFMTEVALEAAAQPPDTPS